MNNRHFSTFVFDQAHRYGSRVVLYDRQHVSEKWKSWSWNELANEILTVAKAFIHLGVAEHDRIGQFSNNRAENLIVDFALYADRAVMVPMYATSSVAQVEFIVNDAEIRVLFVDDQQQYDIAVEVLRNSSWLKKIIVFDNDVRFADDADSMYYSVLVETGESSSHHFEVQHRQNECHDDDLACILYTSGTTGNSKGVMLPHSCLKEAMILNTRQLTSLTDTDISVAFLPLSHVFERMWSYLCLYNGITIYINHKPTEIQQTIREVQPTLMCAVPRFWEKVYAGVQENLSKFSPFMLGVVTWAIATGKKYNIDNLRVGRKPGILIKFKYFIADSIIFSKVKKTLGIQNGNMFPTAGAKLSDEIAMFFRSIGVPVIYGYGLTESTATVSCYDYNDYEIGTIGTVLNGVEVRIGDESEIQLKGKTIFPGYYKNPEANKAAFTNDGWFKTGDAGYFKGNKLVLTERLKDLFKTSNGKYIAPQEIETRLCLDKFIEQVAVIGDERNFVTAIIAPALPALEEYASKNNISFSGYDNLLTNPEILKMMHERIRERQKGMAEYEMIKKFVLIPKSFSIETGELTNTLKIRRTVIMQKYRTQIDEMYAK